MCDTVAGEVLVCFHRDDAAAQSLIDNLTEGNTTLLPTTSRLRVVESLEQRLLRAGIRTQRYLDFRFYRLSGPDGQEDHSADYLQFLYRRSLLDALHHGTLNEHKHSHILHGSRHRFQVAPHSWLSVAQSPSGGGTSMHSSSGASVSFTPEQTHDDYKMMLGWSPPSSSLPSLTSKPKRILVLDTGLDTTASFTPVDQVNFVDQSSGKVAADDHGHGTAVSWIIHDLCPQAELIVYKVGDSKGIVSEWDMLAALAVQNGADLVNISLAFGLPNRNCPTCGRQSHSSRSSVFETMIDQLDQRPDGPVLIASAGNEARTELSFPARFDNVVAIEAINRSKTLSAFSNHATKDHEGNDHLNVFVLPGGEKLSNQPPSEYVGSSRNGRLYWGTSFATAYATGLIAALWTQPLHETKDRRRLLDHLQSSADNSFTGYNDAEHGNGLMKF